MELPKYIGTIHPEEWLKQVQTYCYLKEIENEQKIIKICKLMIDSTITIPNEINSFDELLKELKSHSTFEIFKDTCIARLKSMMYIPEKKGGSTTNFIAKFRSLCNDAEINNPEEIKMLLINSYLSEFFKSEFNKRITGINTVDEILKKFSDVVFEELKTIKYGSLIALKHVATGKYLSSNSDIIYKTGSGNQAVFAGEKFPDTYSLWYANRNIQRASYQNTVFYGDAFYLTHKATGNYLLCYTSHRSPTTGHSEANCNMGYSYFNCINANPTNNNTSYVKTNDVITLKDANSYILRSHDFTFAIGNKTFQEVVGHQERIGGNDEWQIELIEDI